MPVSIPSPSKRWPGTIVVAEPLTFPQYIAWRAALRQAREVQTTFTVNDAAATPELTDALLPGVCACVEAWNLGGDFRDGRPVVTAANFPSTPRQAVYRILLAVIAEINRIVEAEDDDLPKGFSPSPSPTPAAAPNPPK
jgi:hypothetical protein